MTHEPVTEKKCTHPSEIPKAKFIVPDWGDTVVCAYVISLSYRPSGNIGWRAGTTTLCQCRLYPPVRDCEFGYS
jgi:hypothetical protein